MGNKLDIPVKIRIDNVLPNGPYVEQISFGNTEGISKLRVHIPPSGCTIEEIETLLKKKLSPLKRRLKVVAIEIKGAEADPLRNVVELGAESGDYIIFKYAC